MCFHMNCLGQSNPGREGRYAFGIASIMDTANDLSFYVTIWSSDLFLIVSLGQFAKICPGINATVVPVAENELYAVHADRMDFGDA